MMVSSETPRPQIALLGCGVQDIEPLNDAREVDWLLCRHDAGQVYEFVRGDRIVLRLDFAEPLFDLPDLVAVFGVSDRDGLDRLAETWRRSLPSTTVALEWIDQPSPQMILLRAVEHLSRSLSMQRSHAGRLALEFATYRHEFERMEGNFAALEGYVTSAGLAKVRTVFDYPRSDMSVDLGIIPDDEAAARGVVATVEQLLPLNSLGVAGVSIALGATPGQGDEPLQVTLSAIETGQTIASWSLDPRHTAAGWTDLSLERAVDEPALSLVLSIRSPPGANGWTVMLGPPHPYPEFCARTAAGDSLGAPLAMRVFGTLPGTRVPVTTGSVRPEGTRQPDACLLTEASFEAVSEVFLQPVGEGETSVHYDREFAFIQVHPRGDGATTVARLLIMAPSNTWRLSARICLAHEQANPTLFGMLVRPDTGGDADLADLAAVADGMAGFSGWTTLSALQDGNLSTVLPRHDRHRLAVYLLTRQEGGPAFAWARFSDLRLHYLPTVSRAR